MITKKAVLERLKQVIDPELRVNIVDIGLIYKVTINKEKGRTKIHILMTLTTPGCPLAPIIESLVRRALQGWEGLDAKLDVRLEIAFDPPWTVEMMTEEVRAELGLD